MNHSTIESNQQLPTLTLIGAGNVAWHLASAFSEAGYTINCIFSRTMESAQLLTSKIAHKNPSTLATNDLSNILPADIYIIAVKDNALAQVTKAWPETCKGGVVLHTAGTLPIDVISQTSQHYGVLYPMQTFSKDKHVDFSKITCFIEGNDEVAEVAADGIASRVFGNRQKLSSAERRFLHLAAVFACNFTNHMYALAYEILNKHDIAPDCLLPLITETAKKVASISPHAAQTGPAQRGDSLVISKQLEALEDEAELQSIYRLLTNSILKRFQ